MSSFEGMKYGLLDSSPRPALFLRALPANDGTREAAHVCVLVAEEKGS